MINKDELQKLIDASNRLDEIVSLFCFTAGLCDKHNHSGCNRGMVESYHVINDWDNLRKKDQDCIVANILYLDAGGSHTTYQEKFPIRLLYAKGNSSVVYNNWVEEVEEWKEKKRKKREERNRTKNLCQYNYLKSQPQNTL